MKCFAPPLPVLDAQEDDQYEMIDEDTEIDEMEEFVADDEDVAVVDEDIEEYIEDEEEPVVADSERVVDDDAGEYYNCEQKMDDAGNVVFNAIYPEDFDTIDFGIDYTMYSERYPFEMQCKVSGEDGGIHFIAMSPKQFWYKLSETGKTRSNERDPSYYMSFYVYGGAKAYCEEILKMSYPKGKYECVSEKEISPQMTESIKKLSEEQEKKLFTDIGDYAHVGEGTTYANMDAEYGAYVYEYEITTKDKELVFDKFYISVVSNNLYYANETYNDRGTVTEWYILNFCVMEAGNEDLYDDYSNAFDVFAQNAVPTEKYMKLSQLYGEEIGESIRAKRAVDPLTIDMLKEYSKEAQSGYKLDNFNTMVMDVLKGMGTQSFTGNNITVRTNSDIKVVFVDEQSGKLFMSPEANEYPGDAFEELVSTGDPAGEPAADSDDVVEADSEE